MTSDRFVEDDADFIKVTKVGGPLTPGQMCEHLADLHACRAAEDPEGHQAIAFCRCTVAQDYRRMKAAKKADAALFVGKLLADLHSDK